MSELNASGAAKLPLKRRRLACKSMLFPIQTPAQKEFIAKLEDFRKNYMEGRLIACTAMDGTCLGPSPVVTASSPAAQDLEPTDASLLPTSASKKRALDSLSDLPIPQRTRLKQTEARESLIAVEQPTLDYAADKNHSEATRKDSRSPVEGKDAQHAIVLFDSSGDEGGSNNSSVSIEAKARLEMEDRRPNRSSAAHFTAPALAASPKIGSGKAAAKSKQSRLTASVLVGRGYYHEWIDSNMTKQVIYGEVVSCVENDTGGDRSYTIRFAESTRTTANTYASELRNHVPATIALDEVTTFAGCIAYGEKVGTYQDLQSLGIQHPFRWSTPDFIDPADVGGGLLPRWTLTVRGVQITLQVKESGIAGLGRGVWASCLPLGPRRHNVFELAPGDMIDLGVYSPIRAEDRKPEFLALAKNLIHNWECESYNFEVAQHERGGEMNVLDLTADETGYLHAEARASVLPFVNEVDAREEIPSIKADYDPAGSVHYLLGHFDEDYGPFRLRTDGTALELKVNYGPLYEKVRVRKGYSRAKGKRLKQIQEEIAQDDLTAFFDLRSSTIHKVLGILDFTERVCKSYEAAAWPNFKRERALLLCLSLCSRARELEAVSGGVVIKRKFVRKRLKALTKILSRKWNEDEAFQTSMLSQSFYRTVLMELLGTTVESLQAMEPVQFRARIMQHVAG